MICLFIDQQLSDGGGFNASIDFLESCVRVIGNDSCLVLTDKKTNLKPLKKRFSNVEFVKYGAARKIFEYSLLALEKKAYYPQIIRKLPKSKLENLVASYGCSHIAFASPSRYASLLRNIRYSTTVWDFGHRDGIMCPEFYDDGEWRYREALYREILPRAKTIFVESKTNSQRVIEVYNVENHQITLLEFSPQIEPKAEKTPSDNNFVFYPAQYWAHKDHETLLKALRLIKDQDKLNFRLVCCGGDKGKKATIERRVQELCLSENVDLLGFVSSDELDQLYQTMKCCVFPTRLGPTNLPPLEALSYGKPVVLSDVHDQEDDIPGNRVIRFKTGDHSSLAEALLRSQAIWDTPSEFDFLDVLAQRRNRNFCKLELWHRDLGEN